MAVAELNLIGHSTRSPGSNSQESRNTGKGVQSHVAKTSSHAGGDRGGGGRPAGGRGGGGRSRGGGEHDLLVRRRLHDHHHGRLDGSEERGRQPLRRRGGHA